MSRRRSSLVLAPTRSPVSWVILATVTLAGWFAYAVHARYQCFEECELRKVGREFSTEGQFLLIEECPKHGRSFCEAVPESVWMEFRDRGMPEMRTSAGVLR